MKTVTALLLLASAALTTTQTIDPNSVPLATRQAWCSSQLSTCPLLCLQETTAAGTRSNTCVASSLSWTCVCMNGLTPNVQNYSLTVPFYECQEWGNQCVNGCGLANNQCASNCRDQHPCGAQNPTRINATSSSSTSASATATSTGGDFSSFGGSSSSSSSGSSSGGKAASAAGMGAVELLRSCGVFAVAGGLFVAFTVGL